MVAVSHGKPLILIRIVWRDSYGVAGWTEYDSTITVREIESVGFLIAEDERQVVIATSHDQGAKNSSLPWCQVTAIPIEAIIEKKVLKR